MNKDKIIKNLKENNRKLKNQYELQEVRLYSLQHKVDELEEENKRLNNIINELENFIKTYSIPEFTLKEPHRLFMETKIILDKLQELKEGK